MNDDNKSLTEFRLNKLEITMEKLDDRQASLEESFISMRYTIDSLNIKSERYFRIGLLIGGAVISGLITVLVKVLWG